MKRTTALATALSVALMTGALVGCDGQAASSASGSEASTASVSSTTEVTPVSDEMVGELMNAIESAPAYTSVTVTTKQSVIFPGNEQGSEESVESTAVYKYDLSGEKTRTSVEMEDFGVKLVYYTEGEQAVFVSDGGTYAGTTEEFDLRYTAGAGALLDGVIGERDTLAKCAASLEKEQGGDRTFYTLHLDTAKYTESDKALSMQAEAGHPLKEAQITIGFDADGRLVSLERVLSYDASKDVDSLAFTDYDATVVDPMPAADKTFDDDLEGDAQENTSGAATSEQATSVTSSVAESA